MNYHVYTARPTTYTGGGLQAAGCCIITAGKILLIRRGPQRTFAGEYEIPGGKLEARETPEEAAIRETMEEVGIDVSAALSFAGTLYGASLIDPLTIDYEFHVFRAMLPIQPSVLLEAGHTEFRWVTAQEAKQLPCIVGTPEVFKFCAFI